MLRIFTILGALSGFIAVCTGAFGAHALRQRVTPDLLSVFETAARYEMYHALALLAVAWKVQQSPDSLALRLSGWCFFAGIVVFCGSLYLLVLTGSTWLGAVTPFGGIAFLAGWLGLGWEALKSNA